MLLGTVANAASQRLFLEVLAKNSKENIWDFLIVNCIRITRVQAWLAAMEQKRPVKPRLKKYGGTWVCQCRRYGGIGDSPVMAYFNWNKQKYRSKVDGFRRWQ